MTGGGIAMVVAAVLVLYVILGPGLHGLAGFGAGADWPLPPVAGGAPGCGAA